MTDDLLPYQRVYLGLMDGKSFEGLEPRYVRASDGAMVDHHGNVLDFGGAQLTVLGFNEAENVGPEAMAFLASRTRMDWVDFTPTEKDRTMLDETAPPPLVTPSDPAGPPPRALSNLQTHRHFHPSYLRVGVRFDGEERNDVAWYDVDAGRIKLTNGNMREGKVEPYWRWPESRQERRARERWEAKRKGRA